MVALNERLCNAGVWVWGTPVEMTIDGLKVSVLYIDTEGFESVGKSNVYDDRFDLYSSLFINMSF